MLLKTLRSWAQAVISVYMLAQIAWWVVVGAFGLVLVGYMLIKGDYGLAIGTGIGVFGALAALAFLAWITVDAEKSYADIHRQHLKEKPEPNGDMTNVAAGPTTSPPWMGTGQA
jgi:hypothetical protein